jgi:hypothetical protein
MSYMLTDSLELGRREFSALMDGLSDVKLFPYRVEHQHFEYTSKKRCR